LLFVQSKIVVEGFVRCSTLLFSDWSIFVRLVKNTLVV
jgi:hypothetical protein